MTTAVHDGSSRRNGSAALLRVEDISLSFKGVKAVTHISFEVHAGEVLALIGPNGATSARTWSGDASTCPRRARWCSTASRCR